MARKMHGKKIALLGVIVILLMVGYGYYAVHRPLAAIKPNRATSSLQPQGASSKLSWPTAGESAVGLNDDGVLATHNAQKAMPTASVAKVLTALSVLSRYPLSLNQNGPTLTLTANDVALYDKYVALDGSVVPVTAGEQISEYQMLQTMMLPSANNMADSLATWAFGSLGAYTTYGNSYARQIGLTDTHVGSDASGFDPSTTSTPGDLVKLGEAAMQNPVLAQIVGQGSASGIPNTTSIKNVNFLLGDHNIVGIKTGNTDQAGGVYVSASKVTISGQPVTVVTALLGAPTLYDSLADSIPLITSAQSNFSAVQIVSQDSAVGSYTLPWGGSASAVATNTLSAEAWNGNAVDATIQLQPISASAKKGQIIGHIAAAASAFTPSQSSNVILAQTISKPSLWWRLLHA
jgi:D-alanyl-D-alanine carboxypeptidase (penicillin-binding protein 5/6)